MDELSARLESLFRRYAAALDEYPDDRVLVTKQFFEEARLLLARYGQPAIDAALDGAPGEVWPSVSLH
jgi:hypothetical protein